MESQKCWGIINLNEDFYIWNIKVLLKIHITFFFSFDCIVLKIKSAQLKESKAYFLSGFFSEIYNYISDFLCINKSTILLFNFFIHLDRNFFLLNYCWQLLPLNTLLGLRNTTISWCSRTPWVIPSQYLFVAFPSFAQPTNLGFLRIASLAYSHFVFCP